MRGHGFPRTGRSSHHSGHAHRVGFDAGYVAPIMTDYAKQNHTTRRGRHDITVYCINRLSLHNDGEFTSSLECTSPTTSGVLGAAKPTGPPPRRWR